MCCTVLWKSSAITNWRREVKAERSCRLLGYWWSRTISYLFMSRDEWGEALSQLKLFCNAASWTHQGVRVSPCLEKWFCMQHSKQGALLRPRCILVCRSFVVLSSPWMKFTSVSPPSSSHLAHGSLYTPSLCSSDPFAPYLFPGGSAS